ncbi:MAG: beta-lactamase family protein [Pseudomonadota bacterium]|nr:beta-lactamase family protein [Pseudomonadota bacterium]
MSADPKVAAKLRIADKWMATQLAHEGVPGASVAIVHDQQIIWSRGFGHANVEARVPATSQTRYSICSISKLFTSMAAMRERDAGRLDIDKPIGTYIDWYKIKDVEKPDGPVTARGIMSHVAGLPREADTPYWTRAEFPDLASVKSRLAEQSNLYRAYDYQQYSNLGMTLLGEAVASTSRQGYHDYIRAHFLTPLGLTRTTSELPERLYGKELAVGYQARKAGWDRKPFPFYTVNALAPAAGFASTVEDLGKFASWQFRLLEQGGDTILKSSTLREMQRVHWMTPDKPDETWGLGFASFQHAGKTMIGHGGYCPGYRASLMMRPQDKLAYIVMVNVNDANPGKYARELYDLTAADIGKAVSAAKAVPTAATVPAPVTGKQKPDLAIYEGSYSTPRYDDDVYISAYGDDLLVAPLYTASVAKDAEKFRHVSGNLFRRVRADDSLAEELRFDLDASGRAIRAWHHSNYVDRTGS